MNYPNENKILDATESLTGHSDIRVLRPNVNGKLKLVKVISIQDLINSRIENIKLTPKEKASTGYL